jgi:hypothetical protein
MDTDGASNVLVVCNNIKMKRFDFVLTFQNHLVGYFLRYGVLFEIY